MEKYRKVIQKQFKISARTWNDKFKLPNRFYFASDIEDYFEYVLKKHEKKTDNSSIVKFVNKTENRITVKFKTGYYPKHLMIKLLGSTKTKIIKNESGEKVPHIEITEVMLGHWNIVNNDYQEDSRALYPSVPDKSFGQLLDISPKNFVFLNTFYLKFSYIEVWFTHQNSKNLEIKDKIIITLVI